MSFEDEQQGGGATTEAEVKWYNGRKGFGFVLGPDGQDVFFHASALAQAGLQSADTGDKLVCEIGTDRQGRRLVTRIVELKPGPGGGAGGGGSGGFGDRPRVVTSVTGPRAATSAAAAVVASAIVPRVVTSVAAAAMAVAAVASAIVLRVATSVAAVVSAAVVAASAPPRQFRRPSAAAPRVQP
ncbi:cold shock domain-containing protein [Roseomonas sp. CCTCC AB2023176]|uniref:cold shock domain-containing protein n=1 Tax=Roseomonas sp. CCTCC AB2023176 TaxID=3342640 RepID=UPI0035E2A8B7